MRVTKHEREDRKGYDKNHAKNYLFHDESSFGSSEPNHVTAPQFATLKSYCIRSRWMDPNRDPTVPSLDKGFAWRGCEGAETTASRMLGDVSLREGSSLVCTAGSGRTDPNSVGSRGSATRTTAVIRDRCRFRRNRPRPASREWPLWSTQNPNRASRGTL